MMFLNSYQKAATRTRIYKDDHKIMYPALGLCGEAGEVAEKIKKLYRDSEGDVSQDFQLAVKKELGDVLWYIANLANDLGLSLDDIAKTNLKKLAARKKSNKISGSGDDR